MKPTQIVQILLTGACAVSMVFAQGQGTSTGSGNSGNVAARQNPVQRRIQFLTTLLSLSTDQQNQATTIFTNAANAQSAQRTSMQTARQALNDAVKANNGAGIDQAAATIGNLTTQATSIQAKADAAFYQILSADQQAKLTQFQGQWRGGPGPRGGRGMGQGPNGFGGPRR
jgi:Spy/CpxP family protein refolding chaperone